MKNLNAGVHTSPNIQSDSEIYEIENRACDPEGKIEAFLEELIDLSGKRILDVGCGTGFHLPLYAKKAEHVFGLEPHDSSRLKAMHRVFDKGLVNVSVMKGSAETVLLEDESIDFAYSKFAYFWGPGCELGLAEVFRVLKLGGLFVMTDNNLEKGTFGSWVKQSFDFSDSKQKEVDEFWGSQGFVLKTIQSEWVFQTRSDLESVLKIEFPNEYKGIVARHKGLSVDYSFNLYYKYKS